MRLVLLLGYCTVLLLVAATGFVGWRRLLRWCAGVCVVTWTLVLGLWLFGTLSCGRCGAPSVIEVWTPSRSSAEVVARRLITSVRPGGASSATLVRRLGQVLTYRDPADPSTGDSKYTPLTKIVLFAVLWMVILVVGFLAVLGLRAGIVPALLAWWVFLPPGPLFSLPRTGRAWITNLSTALGVGVLLALLGPCTLLGLCILKEWVVVLT